MNGPGRDCESLAGLGEDYETICVDCKHHPFVFNQSVDFFWRASALVAHNGSTTARSTMRCVIVVIAAFSLVSWGVDAGAKSGKTPEETFDAWVDAYKTSGTKGFMKFLTSDSKRAFTGGMLSTLHNARTFLVGKDGREEILKELDELMKRHGFDAKKLKTFVETKADVKSADAMI